MTEREGNAGMTASVRDAKRELLARLLAEEGIAAGPEAIPRRAPGTDPPLSHAQEVLWLLHKATPGLTAYNSALAYRLHGAIDLAALTAAFDDLVARHEALRTRFVGTDDQPVQVVDASGGPALVVEDLRGLPPQDREGAAERVLQEHARRPFDLERDHAFRPVLVRIADDQAHLLLLTNHIISDAGSYGLILRELSALYAARHAGRTPALPEPAIQFGDFAAWERRELQGDRLRDRLRYWRENLLPAGPDLAVPTDHPRPPVPGFEGGRAMLTLPVALLDRAKALATAEGATLYMVLLAAYQLLLHRLSGQDDLVTGSAIAGRTRSETEGVIGYFSGALPLRTRFVEGESFRDLLARVRGTVLGALEHQDVPIEALVRELQAEGRAGHAPLFQAVLTMQDAQGARLELGDVSATPLEVETGATKFELTLLPTERPAGLELLLWYRADLFDPETADRFLSRFATLLAAAVDAPGAPIAGLALLPPSEQSELAAWNATAITLGSPTTMAALLAAAALRRAHETALVSGEDRLPWAELAAKACRLAHHLQAQGVGPDVAVGLCFDRSPDLVVGMMGILLAGGAYVPLLPDLPPARLAQQLQSSGARLVVTSSPHRDRLPSTVPLVCLDTDSAPLAAQPDTMPVCAATPASLAYILFTSGSTGVPKGVGVTHGNLVHYTRAIAHRLDLDLDGSAPWHGATVSTLAADLGHTSVFPILCASGTLHVVPAMVSRDAGQFTAYLAEHRLDLLKLTPSHFQALVGPEFLPEHLPRRWLVVGGEPCPWGLAQSVAARGVCRVLNHYGPTETTVGATTFEFGSTDVSRWSPATVPIGKPLPNVTAHVLDARQQPLPPGVPGELWIGGAGVARGYVGRADLTAERFADLHGERCYRTGDRVRRLPTGDLEFLGRLDAQVKVRGHRVELGEIEAALGQHPSVRQAVVALADDTLVAYVVEHAPVEDSALAAHLGGMLPDYMIPGAWVRLPRLPLTSNGKVDRTALPAPSSATESSHAAPPQGSTETRLAALWSEVLKQDAVGRHDNFFALGGHSLTAIRLLGKIAKQFGVRLPLRTLFENPTVAQLAQVLTPRHPLEAPLAALWAEVLKRETVAPDANFFALGGHSLIAIRLLGKIAKQFGVRLPLRVLFEHPTVQQLAPAIQAAGGHAAGDAS
jgi:amino acid adenylation domain-containing protein